MGWCERSLRQWELNPRTWGRLQKAWGAHTCNISITKRDIPEVFEAVCMRDLTILIYWPGDFLLNTSQVRFFWSVAKSIGYALLQMGVELFRSVANCVLKMQCCFKYMLYCKKLLFFTSLLQSLCLEKKKICRQIMHGLFVAYWNKYLKIIFISNLYFFLNFFPECESWVWVLVCLS